ncbi:MAG: formylglycine-generating enzyme family protein [Pseudomonadota bacterium]
MKTLLQPPTTGFEFRVRLLAGLLVSALCFHASLAAAEQACRSSDGGFGPEMVLIEGDRFTMGSPDGEKGRSSDEGPRHSVTVQPFALGRCEVTVAEFSRFVEETGYESQLRKDGCYVWNKEAKRWSLETGRDWRNPGFSQTDTDPVVCVSHPDAEAYADWLSQRTGVIYRLPTEAEWEYAARAGTVTARYWGDSPDKACEYANVHDLTSKRENEFPRTAHNCDDGFAQTAPAGSFESNRFGLYDMLGNVWEWVEDCWHESYINAPAEGSAWLEAEGGDCGRRVLRGGSWILHPVSVRSAYRLRDAPDDAYLIVGFRLARTLR